MYLTRYPRSAIRDAILTATASLLTALFPEPEDQVLKPNSYGFGKDSGLGCCEDDDAPRRALTSAVHGWYDEIMAWPFNRWFGGVKLNHLRSRHDVNSESSSNETDAKKVREASRATLAFK
jgi:hypothetical protein